MVLSLVNLSLCAITKGIEDGTIRHPHLLSPNLRERVLDTAIKEGLANHPNCLPLLTSVEFLNRTTSISAKVWYHNDLKFLERLISSLATKLPNEQTVGAAIKKLKLRVYDYGIYKDKKTYSVIISKLSDLIAQCPNTVSLALNLRKAGMISGYWPLNENENIACNRVMENLVELSVMSNWECIIGSERPIINFKKLTTLKLEYCHFYNGKWPILLEKMQFLEILHFFDVRVNENGLDWILSSPLPRLKSLEVLGGATFKCNKAFVDKLIECQQLRQVHLMLDQKSTDEESIVRLADFANKTNIDLKMKILLDVAGNDGAENATIFDSSSRFKLVRIFHERMESLELDVWQEWNAQFSTALEDVVNTCSNLTSFGIYQNHPQIEFEEKKRVNAALVRFFGNPERAHQLKGLRLIGNFDETVLSAVFENCVNLVRLIIFQCPTLRDQHLIDWVSRGGGKLTDLVLVKCNNVTSEGIIPILAKSAEGLLRYYCIDLGQDNGGRNWETVLRNHCPNAVIDGYLYRLHK